MTASQLPQHSRLSPCISMTLVMQIHSLIWYQNLWRYCEEIMDNKEFGNNKSVIIVCINLDYSNGTMNMTGTKMNESLSWM